MKKTNLGRELTKNEQKKITGGATLLCSASWSQVVYNFDDCSNAAAYCFYAQDESQVVYCFD